MSAAGFAHAPDDARTRCMPFRADANLAVDTHQLESAEILRARRLLDENVSLERAWSEMQASRGRAASSTVDALVFSLRAGGAALACPHARRRLSALDEAQLHELSARLQKFRPNIARAWTPIEVEFLVAIWIDLIGRQKSPSKLCSASAIRKKT